LQSHSSTAPDTIINNNVDHLVFIPPQTRHITRTPEMYYQSKFLQGSTHILVLTLRIQIQPRLCQFKLYGMAFGMAFRRYILYFLQKFHSVNHSREQHKATRQRRHHQQSTHQ
jgi:hypothetical protein